MENALSFDELLDYLDESEEQYVLDSVATHGFLTAAVIGKPLPNWLETLFENQTSSIPSNVIDGIKRWRQEIENELKNELPISLPFDLSGEDEPMDFSDESDIVAWSIGFVDAMYADEGSDWFDDDDTAEDVATLTLPMIVLSGIGEDDPELVAFRNDNNKLEEMAASLESNLTELFLLFHTND